MVHSKVTGNGLPVVFIHGYAEDLSLWKEIAAKLSKSYQCIALDLPGFGKSTPITGTLSIERVAEKVHDHLTEELNVKNYVVLGHSLGGYVSLAMAELYPSAVLGFGLINSTSLADSDEKKATRVKTAEFITKHGAEFFLTSFVPNLFTPINQQQLKEKVALVLEMGKSLDKNVLSNYMLAMRDRPDRSNLLKTVNNVLFVGGEQDPHFPFQDFTTQINLLKRPEFGHVFKKTAHMSMYEDSNQLIYRILEFLNSVEMTEFTVD